MKYFPTRRTYRRIFRRVRFYLPFVAVLLILMVLFLPISGGWLAGWASREAGKRFDLEVVLGRLEVTLAEARVEAFNAGVEDPRGESVGFQVGRVEADGRLSHLLAGGEKWPDTIRVDGLPPLRLTLDEEGVYQLNGPYQTLRAVIERLSGEAASSRPAAGREGTGVGRTPGVVISALPIFVEPWRDDLPPLYITLDEVVIPERPSREAPVRLGIRGVATAETTEPFNFRGIYFPDQERLSLKGQLAGLAIPFTVPPLGRFLGSAKDMDLEAELSMNGDALLTGSVTARAGRFSISRDQVGGERWTDEALAVRIRFRYDLETRDVFVDEVSLSGDQIDVGLEGKAVLGGDFPGEARIGVRRLPAAALALGQNELTERLGITVEQAATSPTLRVDGTVSGPFAQPADLKSVATLRAGGWQLRSPLLGEPVMIDGLALRVTPRSAAVERLELRFGGLSLEAEGELPLVPTEENGTGHVSVRLDGDADAVFDLLLDQGVLPREISSLSAPISLVGAMDLTASRNVRGGLDLKPKLETLEGTLTWQEGELELRMLGSPVRLFSGEVRLRGGLVSVERVRAQVDGLDVSVSGKLRVDPAAPSLPGATGNVDVSSSGDIVGLYSLASRVATLPQAPAGLGGNYQLEASASGSLDSLEAVDYKARLVVDNGTARIDVPYKQVPLENIAAEISLNREVLEVRRLSLSVTDESAGTSTAELRAAVTESEVRAEGKGRVELALLPVVLPRDLRSVYMEGLVPATAWATLTPSNPLPAGPDVIRRWIAFLQQPGLEVSPNPNADLVADFEVDYRQEGPLSVFPREFPVRASNLRGNARLVPGELRVTDTEVDIGSAKDIKVDELTLFFGRPTRVEFTAEVDHLDVNEWLSGWGDQDWSSERFSFTPRWRSHPEPYQFASVDGYISAKTIKFLQYDGQEASTDFHFEAWSRRPPRITLENLRLNAYEGSSEGRVEMTFPRGEKAVIGVTAAVDHISLNPFVNALREKDQKLDGYLTGELDFFGQLINYPTYVGEAEFTVAESSVVGNIILVYAREFFRSWSGTGGHDSTIEGRVRMAGEKVNFPRLVIMHPNIKIASDGYVDFRGRLFFDVAANFIGRQFQDIPLLGTVGSVIDRLGNEMVMYRVSGKLGNPKTTAIPGLVPRLQQLRGLFGEAEE